uniref:Uncharacterized protein n=1 Tax=Cyprinodon variegatus TaxID=28743 RepID=A0A3Q2EBG6_CYPVA
MLTDEVSHIQEVRYCLKSLREQMAARQNSNFNKVISMFPNASKCAEKLTFSNECRIRLAEQSVRLQAVELQSEEKAQQVEELQRLLEGMRMESNLLKDKMEAGEAELLQLKKNREGGVAVLKEKIHHLDDMLKSQQRKLRHMIEQLQHARTIIQERDRVIMDLEEKVAFLEAEVSNLMVKKVAITATLKPLFIQGLLKTNNLPFK